MTITLLNGTIIWFKSGDNPDSLYGEDVWACVIDEASRVKEDSWHAVRSTLTATNAPIRIIGNVKGRKNWAYLLARKAEGGEQGMSYHKITAHDAIQAGVITTAEVEDAKRQLPESIFKELYLAEPSDDEGNPFGIKSIKECVKPLSHGTAQVYGIDLAKSVDFTVIIGLDSNHNVCKFERFQSPWQETISRIKNVIGAQRAIVDSTGVGDPIVEQLKRANLKVEGYKFTQASKQQLMEGLAYAIQQHLISYPDGVIAQELDSFEYQYTRTGVRYSAPEGLHDDCVCALALANSGFRRLPAEIRWI
jgi:phage FluMu gp28-like protein